MNKRDLMVVSARQLTEDSLKKILNNALKEHEHDILDMQKEQLSGGLLDKGDEIAPPYAKKTIEKKKAKGQEVDRVTLNDTGSFYRKQYVKYSKDHFEITSRDRKRNKLVRKYDGGGRLGGDVFGLTEENREMLRDMLLPELQILIKDKLFRKK